MAAGFFVGAVVGVFLAGAAVAEAFFFVALSAVACLLDEAAFFAADAFTSGAFFPSCAVTDTGFSV